MRTAVSITIISVLHVVGSNSQLRAVYSYKILILLCFFSDLIILLRCRLSGLLTKASKNEIHSPWYKRQHNAPFCSMDVRDRLAVNMKRLRKERGWSQEALADAAGLDRTYISGIERTVRNPTLLVLDRIAKALKCGVGDLAD